MTTSVGEYLSMPMPAELPNSDFAVIEEDKIRHYLLASGHPAGRGKAAFFQRLGFSPAAWEKLRDGLLDHARSARLLAINDTPFGRKYVLEGPLPSPDGRNPRVRGVWFLAVGETRPRLVTAYAASGAGP
jgi:hypothetical protein